MNKTRWGIIGTGHIAGKFAEGLTYLEDAELVAVGSRAQETADRFGEEWRVPRRHASYRALAEDPDVDVVYVATPHVFHMDNTILCMESGKPVLCEKPLAINARQVRRMIACARERGLFLMEAMWSRFIPGTRKLCDLLEEKAVGQVQMVKADFCFRSGWDPEGRLLNPEMGGGGLLDVGCYTISFASMVYGGPPEEVGGLADIGETGVDEQAGMVLRQADGSLSVLTCAVRTRTPSEAWIFGTEGMIHVHSPFFRPSQLTVRRGDGEQQMELPHEGNGYNYEAAEVSRCLREGLTESPDMTLDESLTIMLTMDRLRQQWGLEYPTE